MNRTKKVLMAASLSGAVLAGGVVGVTVFGPMAVGANSPAGVPAGIPAAVPAEAPAAFVPFAVTSTATPGVDHSNNTPAHEAGESAATEAAETAGQGHGPGGGGNHVSNKDPAHEASESPARAAEEATRDAAIAKGVTSTATG